MLVFELFNSEFDTTWRETQYGWEGSFKIGADKFELFLDEYGTMLDGKEVSIIDFGFKKNGSWNLSPNNTEFRSLGGVLNTFIKKINEIQPDVILFGAFNKHGDMEGRAKLYQALSRLFAKGSSYHYESEWYPSKNGKYKFLAKSEPSETAKKEIDLTINNLGMKS